MLPVARAAGTSSWRIDSAVTDLPEPLSPTSASVSPRWTSRSMPATASVAPKLMRRSWIRSSGGVTAAAFVARGGWLMGGVALTAAGCAPTAGAIARVRRGSKASRTASAMKISSVSMSAMTTKPVMPSHGARRLFLPCSRSSPSEGDPGGSPNPRKSSAVRVTTAPLVMNGRNVNDEVIAFGRRCRNMIAASRTPRARAART